jgi:predicted house-cleaning noncanonical NTP pyrophosphatase (MazG superfamily)
VRKLVRDNIPELIRSESPGVKTGVYGKKGFRAALLDKLVEEATEARATEGAEFLLAEELADLWEAMSAAAEEFGVPWEMVELEREAKLRKKGGFAGRKWADFK